MACRKVSASNGNEVGVGLIGLGNVGLGTLEVLAGNASVNSRKAGIALAVKAVCSRTVHEKALSACSEGVVSNYKLARYRFPILRLMSLWN